MEVAERLERYFDGEIRNPVLDAVLNDNWTVEDRTGLKQGALNLYKCMRTAVILIDNRSIALAELTEAFGPRIPQNVTLIVATAEATVKSYQPTKVPAPNVPRTTSG